MKMANNTYDTNLVKSTKLVRFVFDFILFNVTLVQSNYCKICHTME